MVAGVIELEDEGAAGHDAGSAGEEAWGWGGGFGVSIWEPLYLGTRA